jgi:glutathione S-transferase
MSLQVVPNLKEHHLLQDTYVITRLNLSRAQRIVWLLEELGVEYDLKTFKRNKDMLAPPELKDVHPLGKAPVVGIKAPALQDELRLAESGAIVEYLTEHFGTWLIPKKYAEGKEGQVGGETETWLRYRFFLHYAEGSLMVLLLVALILQRKHERVPASSHCSLKL